MYKRLFKEHSSLALIMSNFAALLREQSRLNEAEQFQIEALNMHRKLTGEESIDVALGVGSLGHIYMLKGQFSKAEPLLTKSINRLTNIYGEIHPYIARTKLNMGKLYFQKGNLNQAENILLQVNSDYQKVFPTTQGHQIHICNWSYYTC